MMEEKRYMELAYAALRRIEAAFDEVDVDDADPEPHGDVITITFRGGSRCVVNTQRPARQIWLAGGAKAWHFSYDEAEGRWLDDKGEGAELFSTLAEITRAACGVELSF